jgi:membrane-associated phospholipid phosphatase
MPDHKPISQPLEELREDVQHLAEQAEREVSRSRVPWYRASRRTVFFIALYLIEFVLFTLLAVIVHFHPVDWIDLAITREFQENTSSWLVTSMTAVSYLGYHPFLFTGLILVTAIIFWLVRLRLEALYVIILPAASFILNFVLKLIVQRPRPTAQLVEVFRHASGESFPSGHVMSYVAYWALLLSLGIILLKRDRWWHYLVLIIPALFVILVGPSRIYLGAHWASDVLGAYLFGSLLLGVSLWIYLILKRCGVLAAKRKPGEPLLEPEPITSSSSPSSESANPL